MGSHSTRRWADDLTGVGSVNATGNAPANQLIGNAGNNVLNGGLGNDTMIGGAGNDTFIFNSALGAGNIDGISDFNVTDDTIHLDDAVFTALTTASTLATDAFAANADGFATTAVHRIIYETDTGQLYYDSDGDGVNERVQFASRFWRQGLDEIRPMGSRLVARDRVPLFFAWLTPGRSTVWSSRPLQWVLRFRISLCSCPF